MPMAGQRTACPAGRTSTSSPDLRLGGVVSRVALAPGLALGLALALAPAASLAQDLDSSEELEALIPDAAVADPEGWAAQGAGEVAPDDEVAPADPFADDPDAAWLDDALLSLDDPADLDLPQIIPLEPGEQVEFVTFDDVIPPLPAGSEAQVSDELVLVFPTDLALFPVRDEFIARFKSLSAVEDLSSDGSQARLAAQARADEELLQRMLRVYGYFDAQVIRSVVAPEDRDTADAGTAIARFDIIPGPRYHVGTVDLGALDQTGADHEALRAAYPVNSGDPLSIDAIADGRYALDRELGERGYPFAAIAEPGLLVDHARDEGDVTLPVTPGGRYAFGRVRSNMEGFLSGRHLERIARFDAGDIYQRSLETDLRQAILATGLIGSVTMTPVVTEEPVGDAPGTVDMAVNLTPAPLRTLAGSIGYGTEEGIRLAASWEHRNLFPPEGMLRLRGIAGTQEQLLGATFRKNNFRGRDRVLTLDAFASTIDNDAFIADTASLTASYEQVSTLLFQKPLSWGFGLELVATDESERKARNLPPLPGETFLIAALPARAQFDTSDSLLDPTRGLRLRGAVSPEYSRTDGAGSTYLKVQFDLSAYRSASDGVVLAARARLGTILGTGIANIAPSRRFYAGGGGSVRGYGYQAIGPRDGLGEPNGGRSLLEFSAEARVQTGLMDGAIALVPFVDAGLVNVESVPDFSDIRLGVGMGVRYQTGFGPIRLDVGVPLNRQPGDGPVAVYVALGQAF